MPDNPSPPKDPMQAWREMREAATEQWAKAMTEFVGTEAFAKTMGASIDAYLATAAPYQKVVGEYMEQVLARLNMPSREDVLGLARRLTNVETRLDDLDARLDQLEGTFQRLDQRLDTILEAVREAGNATSANPEGPRPPRQSAGGSDV